MNYKNLGTTDLKVSSICLGTMTWGYQNTQEDAFEQMDYALDQGINFWDTAELYAVPPRAETYGHTEAIIGNWFEQNKKRDKVILASKVAGPGRPHIRGGAYSYGIDNLTEALNDSLNRLKTDYIDLYQLHWPERPANYFGKLGYQHEEKNDWNQFEDVLGNLQTFIDQGKIRYIGLSNETPWGVNKCLELSKINQLPRIMSIQNSYSLLNRTFEIGLAEISIREKVSMLGYSPLTSGYLTGKYRNNQRPANARITLNPDFWVRNEKPNTAPAVETYYAIAKNYNLILSQMALKFCQIQPFMTSVIIGATSMEQLKSNIQSMDINLTDEIINEINKVQQLYSNPCP